MTGLLESRVVVRRGRGVSAPPRAALGTIVSGMNLGYYIDFRGAESQWKSRGLGVISREQCRAARALVQMSQVQLAAASGLSKQTVIDFERGVRSPHKSNLQALQSALEAAGVEFIAANGGGRGVRLQK